MPFSSWFRCFRAKQYQHTEEQFGPTLLGRGNSAEQLGSSGKNWIRRSAIDSTDHRRVSVRARQSVVCMADFNGKLNDEAARAEIYLEMAKEEQEYDNSAIDQIDDDAEARPLIAIIAHDNMKPLMTAFANSYKELLQDFRLTGTSATCAMLSEIGLEPEDTFVPSGPLGGDQVLGHFITQGEIRALFFFRDPLSVHAHVADMEALSRLADVYQIYFASNYRTAAATLETLHDDMIHMKEKKSGPSRPSMPEGIVSQLPAIKQ